MLGQVRELDKGGLGLFVYKKLMLHTNRNGELKMENG